ncbi:MAG: xylulokinase [Pseudomonadota bacterium]
MTGRLVAGVDCSTQATKVVVVDVDQGDRVAEGRAAHQVLRQGAISETDPDHWWRALAAALSSTGLADRVDAVSIAAQQLGLVTLDADHRPLRPAVLWDDTRSAYAAERLQTALGGRQAWARHVGTQPVAGLTVASWVWLREAEPETAGRTAHVRLPHDFLTERLTGNGVTDRGDASGTGWWSSRREAYVPEVLDLPIVDLKPSMLPRVLAADEVAGQVTPMAAQWTGLRAGIPVACGTGDNMSAALALAIEPGEPVISLGTSGTAYMRADRAPADPTGQVFADASASGDHLPLTCTLNATLAVDNMARLLSLARDAVAERTDVVVMPYLSGERLPDYPLARGSILGIDHATSGGEVLLAAYEGVAYSLVRSLDVLAAQTSPIAPDAPILLIGGGARSRIWQDTVARLSGRALVIPGADELVAWGAAAQAAGLLAGQPAVDVARRWNVAKGAVVQARAVDQTALDRIARVRHAADALNTADFFASSDTAPEAP